MLYFFVTDFILRDASVTNCAHLFFESSVKTLPALLKRLVIVEKVCHLSTSLEICPLSHYIIFVSGVKKC